MSEARDQRKSTQLGIVHDFEQELYFFVFKWEVINELDWFASVTWQAEVTYLVGELEVQKKMYQTRVEVAKISVDVILPGVRDIVGPRSERDIGVAAQVQVMNGLGSGLNFGCLVPRFSGTLSFRQFNYTSICDTTV